MSVVMLKSFNTLCEQIPNVDPLVDLVLENIFPVNENFEIYKIKLKSNCDKWSLIENGNIWKHIETHIFKGPFNSKKWKIICDKSSVSIIDKTNDILMFKATSKYIVDFLNDYINYEHRYIEYSKTYNDKKIRIKIECNGNRIIYIDHDYCGLINGQWMFTTDGIFFHELHEYFYREFGDTFIVDVGYFLSIAKKLNPLFDSTININYNSHTNISNILEAKINRILLLKKINNFLVRCDVSGNIISTLSYKHSHETTSSIVIDFYQNIQIDQLHETVSKTIENFLCDNYFGNLTIKINTNNIIYYYQMGPNEIITFYDKNTNICHYKSTNTITKEVNIELTMNVDGDYQIISANDEAMTKDKELIVWKGCYSTDKKPCLVKLIVPTNSKIIPNNDPSNTQKFRTNKTRVAGIYQINMYKCYHCQNIGIYRNPDNYHYYCMLCAREKEYQFIDLDKCKQLQCCEAPFHKFKYTIDDNITVSPFSTTIGSKCDQSGIYFFIDKQMVCDYVFSENITQTQSSSRSCNNSSRSCNNSSSNSNNANTSLLNCVLL